MRASETVVCPLLFLPMRASETVVCPLLFLLFRDAEALQRNDHFLAEFTSTKQHHAQRAGRKGGQLPRTRLDVA